ncbi:hypothetical protein NHQ30_002738 [Ciborinia camelliae]|nr:hypothetical protein NHQ30_002738 [Ciborinia camelliae]
MGDKNNRGRAQQVPAAHQNAERQLAAKRLAENTRNMAIANQLLKQQAQARQDALDFDYTTLPQHPALHVEKDSITAKLFIKIDIVHPSLTLKEVNFLTILPMYAPLIRNIEVLLIAPTYHESLEIYNLRVKNMMKTIDVLNTFNLDEFEFVVSLNRLDNFLQMKLAAACFGLNFDYWTMRTTIFGDKEKGFKVGVHSAIARRLAGVYRCEFLAQNGL